MSDLINIAVDAMGGDGSPKKVIDGIVHNHKSNKENFFKIFGNREQIQNYIQNKVDQNYFEIIGTNNFVKSTDSPLEAAKRGKDTSMWMAIDSVKKKEDFCHIIPKFGKLKTLLDKYFNKLNKANSFLSKRIRNLLFTQN